MLGHTYSDTETDGGLGRKEGHDLYIKRSFFHFIKNA